ncbi:uncharacterized protein [Rutidosis leptorrhynchoides]|uniref:uncharacterized protein n=1 Tax=Rutidosis leptorrhynchoides TaxID=125765 RepID=UPI003A9A63A8
MGFITKLVEDRDEAWVLCGDFNEVRDQSDRLNYVYVDSRAACLNNFIHSSNLIDISIGGRFYTRVSDDGTKFSKLYRFLVLKNFYLSWGNLSAVAMERTSFDHCPILLKDEVENFGPKPFDIFDVWLDEDGIDRVIMDMWSEIVIVGTRKDCIFKLLNVKKKHLV